MSHETLDPPPAGRGPAPRMWVKPGSHPDRPTAPPAPPVPPDPRPARLLNMGRSLERLSKPRAALPCYLQVVMGYPGTAEATLAAARVKAVGAK